MLFFLFFSPQLISQRGSNGLFQRKQVSMVPEESPTFQGVGGGGGSNFFQGEGGGGGVGFQLPK